MSEKTVSQLSTTSTASSSAASEAATYHLEQLSAILTMHLPQEMTALRADKQLIERKYIELNEKYNDLVDQHSCQSKELEELRAFKALTLSAAVTRDNECQTDGDSHSSLNVKDVHRRKLFLSANDSDVCVSVTDNTILVNDSSNESKFVDNTAIYDNDWISDSDMIDEVPDSLNGSQSSVKHIESDVRNTNASNTLCDDLSDINIGANNERVVAMTDFDDFPDEIPDSLNNSPISCDMNFEEEEQNVNEMRAAKSSNESVIEINDDHSSDFDTKSSNKTNHILAKNKQQTTKSTNNNTNNNKSVKLVIKTLGPAVRKKDDRKQLTGYACKECEDYYKQRYRGITEEEMRAKMTKCSRHRSKWSPYKSPEHYWDTDFPSTQEMLRNGNMRYDEKPEPRIASKSKKKLKL